MAEVRSPGRTGFRFMRRTAAGTKWRRAAGAHARGSTEADRGSSRGKAEKRAGAGSVSPSLSMSRADPGPAAALSKTNRQIFRRVKKRARLELKTRSNFLLICQME